jgi:hypothetical protein
LKKAFINWVDSGTYDLVRYENDLAKERWGTYTKRYKAAAGALWPYVSKSGNKSAMLRALAAPVDDIRSLDQKSSQAAGAEKQTAPFFDTEKLQSDDVLEAIIREPVSVPTILEHVELLLESHQFFEVSSALQAGDPKNAIKAAAGDSFSARYLLTWAKDLLKIAIVQQVLLEGDVFLPDIEHVWRQGANPARGEYESANDFARRIAAWATVAKLLWDQPLLRQNLLLYSVRRAVTDRQSSVTAYAYAYARQDDSSEICRLLPAPQFTVEWVPPPAGMQPRPNLLQPAQSTGWHVVIDVPTADQQTPPNKLRVPLPTPEELGAGRLLHAPALETLTHLYARVIAELEGYELLKTLPAYRQQALRVAAWQGVGW